MDEVFSPAADSSSWPWTVTGFEAKRSTLKNRFRPFSPAEGPHPPKGTDGSGLRGIGIL